jgi:hypothetical protein
MTSPICPSAPGTSTLETFLADFKARFDPPDLEPWDVKTRPPRQKRKRRPSPSSLIARAKRLGVDVTIDRDGAAMFHCSSIAPTKIESNEWDEVLSHGKH